MRRNEKITALYERLSRDDDQQRESNSISNQKAMLEEFAARQGLTNIVHFTDDGISGTCFDRPGFLAMMKEVEAGNVEYLCIKDMSRMGRDYLKVGQIMEILRQRGVRLIAINDGVDSARGDDDFTPFRNIMNEYYARDTSRKIRSTFQSKGKSGKHLTGTVIYGYLWNEARDQWLVDPEAADVVKRIFAMTIDGYGPYQIASKLKEEKILIPSAYLAQHGEGVNKNKTFKDVYGWGSSTICNILEKREYLGHTINFKTRKHFKDKKSHYVPEDEWTIFENAAKGNAHVLVIVGVFLLLILMVMSGFSSCGILFSGGTQVSGQTMYSAEDRDIRGAEQDYKKLEKELDKKIKRTPADHPGYNEYQYHLDPIEHDPWQLTSFLTTLYDDYTRSEVQGKLKETFKKQYKLTTWVEVQTRYMTVWVISPAGIPVPTQVPYEYKIFHTKLVNRGLEVVIREELDNDQWKRYEIFQDTLGGRPYLFNGGLPPGGSDGSGTPGIDYQIPAEALTDSEFAAIYKEAQKYVGTPYVWGGSTPETGFDCSGYVCWVYNQNGYDVGRTTANGLWNKSQHISEAEAKPGDLVFFEGTYDTPGKSHVGIYLGNGMMVSAGDPIKYANIHSSYWEKHLAGFGRLSK